MFFTPRLCVRHSFPHYHRINVIKHEAQQPDHGQAQVNVPNANGVQNFDLQERGVDGSCNADEFGD